VPSAAADDGEQRLGLADLGDVAGRQIAVHQAVDIYTFCLRGGSDGQG
jgi:hypothetical protein